VSTWGWQGSSAEEKRGRGRGEQASNRAGRRPATRVHGHTTTICWAAGCAVRRVEMDRRAVCTMRGLRVELPVAAKGDWSTHHAPPSNPSRDDSFNRFLPPTPRNRRGELSGAACCVAFAYCLPTQQAHTSAALVRSTRGAPWTVASLGHGMALAALAGLAGHCLLSSPARAEPTPRLFGPAPSSTLQQTAEDSARLNLKKTRE